MNLSRLTEDVRQLFINSEFLKDKTKSLKVDNPTEIKARERAEKYIENIQAEVLCFNEFLSSLTECNTEDDLNFLLDSNEENYE